MTDAERLKLPKKIANGAEVETYNHLAASLSDLVDAAADESPIKKRLQMIPGGWRDMRMIATRMENLLRSIFYTFEDGKRAQIRRTQQRMRHKLIIGPQVCGDETQFVLCEKDFGILLFAATDRCKTCLGTPAECKRCQLGKTLDAVSFISRGEDRGWWEVMEQAANAEEGTFE